jgi:hypothetical protein
VRSAPTESGRGPQPQDRVAKLAADFPWPQAPPQVPIPIGPLGWLADGAADVLSGELTVATRVVVELGSWLGVSTRFIADHAACATVIAIDHWQGSVEHHEQAACRDMLPRLHESFLAMNWSYRHRVIPLKMTTIEGLQVVAAHEVVPDLIYIDADHRYDSVLEDLSCASRLFADAVLVGDDYDYPDVQRAVTDFASQRELVVQVVGEHWRAWKLLARRPRGPVQPGSPQATVASRDLVTDRKMGRIEKGYIESHVAPPPALTQRLGKSPDQLGTCQTALAARSASSLGSLLFMKAKSRTKAGIQYLPISSPVRPTRDRLPL